MVFFELRFVAFFIVTFAVYWMLRSNEQRKWFLLAGSYLCYGAWDWRFLGLIVFVSGLVYFGSIAYADTDNPSRRKAITTIVVGGNLLTLFVFKYFNFFIESLADLAGALGFALRLDTLSLILPVGISFYVFQSISLYLDVARGALPASRSLVDVFLYIAFFPQLVAGPIVRAADFIPQLERPRLFSSVPVRLCLVVFLVGFFKKTGIADNIAPFVDKVFDAPAQYTALSQIVAVVLYSIQIYCDFSGYSDMALATAGLLGYWIPMNFNFPYFAANIADFWRRWHMSLSFFLRDYLYVALGGNRGTRLRTYWNLFLTMLLGGLWHGASYNFVIWGALHGSFLAGHRLLFRDWNIQLFRGPVGTFFAILATYYLVCLAWIFFRAEDLGKALVMTKGYVLFQSAGTTVLPSALFAVVAAALALHLVTYRTKVLETFANLPAWLFALVFSAAAALALSLKASGYQAFIYFQF